HQQHRGNPSFHRKSLASHSVSSTHGNETVPDLEVQRHQASLNGAGAEESFQKGAVTELLFFRHVNRLATLSDDLQVTLCLPTFLEHFREPLPDYARVQVGFDVYARRQFTRLNEIVGGTRLFHRQGSDR